MLRHASLIAAEAATKAATPPKSSRGASRMLLATVSAAHHTRHLNLLYPPLAVGTLNGNGTPGGESHIPTSHRGFAASASAAASSHASNLGACWSCSAPRPGADYFFCGACGVLQPAAADAAELSPDLFFRILGVHPRFAVDPVELESAMKTLQKSLHPDKFSTGSAREREHSAAGPETLSLVHL